MGPGERGVEADDVPPGVGRLTVAAEQGKRNGKVDVGLHEAGGQGRGSAEGVHRLGVSAAQRERHPEVEPGKGEIVAQPGRDEKRVDPFVVPAQAPKGRAEGVVRLGPPGPQEGGLAERRFRFALAARPDERHPERISRRRAPGVIAHRRSPAPDAVRRILDGKVFPHSVFCSLPRPGVHRQKMR